MKITKRSGFTLIELMLALSFIGILLIATVVTVIHVTHQYSKGVTYKLVNQTGRDLGAAIKRDAASVSAVASPLVQPASNNGELGRLCLGSYSYVWSNPAKLRDNTATKYANSDRPVVMARVPDSGGRYCTAGVTGDYNTIVSLDGVTEMLPSNSGDYAIHEITVDKIAASGANALPSLYKIAYTIGTNEEDTINSTFRCEPPANLKSNFDFCAVNRFELMVEAGY